MAAVTVVVAEHSPVVHMAYQMIDVGEIVLRHGAIRRLPYFFPQPGSAPGSLQNERFVDGFFLKRPLSGFSRHSPVYRRWGIE